MGAIDELQRLLDERGVKFKTHDTIIGKAVTWHGSVCDWVALPDEKGLAVGVYKDYLTPERAIAATLGGQPARLTVEQARELIAPHLDARPTFDFGCHGAVWSADFQAIADELNATLGNGECKNEWAKFGKFRCSKCWLQIDAISTNTTQPMPIKYCPRCGKVVN